MPNDFSQIGPGSNYSNDNEADKELWEEPIWEFVQVGLTMFIALLALCGLPCCFLYTRDRFDKRKKKKDDKKSKKKKDIEMNAIRSGKKRGKKGRDKIAHEAVQGFLEEFVPKASCPYYKGDERFTEVE